MRNIWDVLKATGAIIAVFGPMIGLVVYIVHLDDRVHALEAQMQAIETAPIGKKASNPIQQACANLAEREANQGYTESTYTKDIMEQLGCERIGNQ